jgi:hypothetical protein
MKFRPTLLFSFCLTVVLFSSGIAFAQAPAPAPSVITTQSAIVVILALIVGYIGQAVNTGNLFGIVTTPQAWIPYLTLLGSFLAAFGTSLQGDSTLNGAAWFNAVIAGFTALMAAAGGSAAHNHFQTHKNTLAKRAAAAAAAAAAPPSPPPAPKA